MIKRKLLVGCCLTIGLMLAGCGDKEVSNQSATTTQVETTTEAETTTEVETTTEEETSTEEEVTTGVEDETTEAPTEPVTEAPTESVTEAVKPTEAPTQKPVETQAPTTKPVETQPPTQAPTQAPVITPTTSYVFEEPEVVPPKPYDYKEDQAIFRQRVADYDNEEELVKLAAEGRALNPIIFTSRDAMLMVTFWDVPEEEAWEIVYSSGVDWKEHAYNVAMKRWGTADGFDEAYVRYYLEYFGFSKGEAEYGASKWAENPPYETAIDWFEMAKRCAAPSSDDLSFLGTSLRKADAELWKGTNVANYDFTWEEVEYGAQFLAD